MDFHKAHNFVNTSLHQLFVQVANNLAPEPVEQCPFQPRKTVEIESEQQQPQSPHPRRPH